MPLVLIVASHSHWEENTPRSEPRQKQGKAQELADCVVYIYDVGFCIQVQYNAKSAPCKQVEKSGFKETEGGFLSAFIGIVHTILMKAKIIPHLNVKW